MENTEILKNPRLFAKGWLALSGIKINPQGQLIDLKRRMVTSIYASAWLDYCEQRNAHNAIEASKANKDRNTIKSFSERELQAALDEIVDNTKAQFRAETITKIKCNKEDLSSVRNLIAAWTGVADEKAVAVISHYIWLIKRKMLGLACRDHIMPVLFSEAQGSGKSTAVERLLSVIAEYRLDLTLAQLSDSRNFIAMADNYAIVADEMQHAARTDIDSLKNVITSLNLDCRVLGTNRIVKVANSVTFIGTTNRQVSEIIRDTAMRRFYQIDVLSKMDWEAINKIDYLALWRGIDENRAEGYLAMQKAEIAEEQAKLATPEPTDVFISEMQLKIENPLEFKEVTAEEMYAAYAAWAKASGITYILNKIALGRALANRGFEKRKARVGNNAQNLWRVNKYAELYSEIEFRDNVLKLKK